MDSRLETLEKGLESVKKLVEEREERVSHQLEDLRAMFASFMSRQNTEK